MFSGIVQAKAHVLSVRQTDACLSVRVAKPRSWKLSKGQSIAVSGICSTVVTGGAGYFDVEYMPETLAKTTASLLERGSVVNLERSLRYGDYIDGHVVQGHVDCVGVVEGLAVRGSSRKVEVRLPRAFFASTVLHGSIAVDGVSLTIAGKRGSAITVALIPYTLSHTGLLMLEKGSRVNIELDHSAVLLKKTQRARVRPNEKGRIRKGR